MNNFIDTWAPPVVKWSGWMFCVLGALATLFGASAAVIPCVFGLALCGWYRLDMLIEDLYTREPLDEIEEESE